MTHLLLIFVLASQAAAPQPNPAPQSPPEGEELKQIEKTLKELFKAEYAKKSPRDRLALAGKLLDHVKAVDGPGTKFVLYREAHDFYTQAGDLEGAFKVAEECARGFTIDEIEWKNRSLATAAKSAKTLEEHKKVAQAHLRVADLGLRLDQYDAADKAAQAAAALAKKTSAPLLVTRAADKAKEVADSKAAFEKVKAAREILASDPENPDANLALGRFLAVNKGDWPAALPLLAKGSEPAVRELAEKDLAMPRPTPERMALADAWWASGTGETPWRGPKARAVYWYELIQFGVTGADKAKIQQRLAEYYSARLFQGTWVELSDPKVFGLTGKAGDPIVRKTRDELALKQPPKGEFDAFSFRIKTMPGVEGTLLTSFRYEKDLEATIDFFGHQVRFTRLVDDFWKPEKAGPIGARDEHVFTIAFTEGHIVLYVDGKERVRTPTQMDRLPTFVIKTVGGPGSYDQFKLRMKE